MGINGYNPLRHKCETSGCFNEVHRPKIEEFAECFGGNNNFGDCDGMVEKKGKICMLEWKGLNGKLVGGQIIAFEHLTMNSDGTHNGNVVFVIEGEPRTMAVTRYCMFWGGRQMEWVSGDFNSVKELIRQWDTWASRQFFPRTPGGLDCVGFYK